jgi:hypothetical protein
MIIRCVAISAEGHLTRQHAVPQVGHPWRLYGADLLEPDGLVEAFE